MRRTATLLSLFAVTLMLCASLAHAQVPPHPRLIINPDILAELQEQIAPVDPDWHNWNERERACNLSYRSIVYSAEKTVDPPLAYDNNYWDATQGGFRQLLTSLALAHQLRRQTQGYDDEYLDYAMGLLDYVRLHNYPTWEARTPQGKLQPLSGGEMLVGWALAFDWFYQDMTPTQISNNKAALLYLLYNQDTSGITQGHYSHNYLGVAFGGRGLACMALQGESLSPTDEANRNTWLTQAATRVRDYLDNGFDTGGAGYEGVFYSIYGLSCALPFGLANDRLSAYLQASQRVETMNRGVQQAGTWLLYEQRPDNPWGGTPLNDTAPPPVDLNCWQWRSWPWLLAFASAEKPTGIKHLFKTIYPPVDWETVLPVTFDPDNPTSAAVLFNKVKGIPNGPYGDQWYGSAFDILLTWPDQGQDAAYLDAADLPPTRFFPGRGITYFRQQLHLLDPGGALIPDDDGWQITFECRKVPWWNPGPMDHHAQMDTNHYTIRWLGHGVAWDTGYGTYSSGGHNARELWNGSAFVSPYSFYGYLTHGLAGRADAPSISIGDDTYSWNHGSPQFVDRSQRTFVVLPREGEGDPPYIMMYDDIDFLGSSATKARLLWHSDQAVSDFDFAGNTIRSEVGEAGALMTIARPSGMTFGQFVWDPENENWPSHWTATMDTPVSKNPNVVSIIDLYRTGGPAALDPPTALTTSDPATAFAYLITGSGTLDLVLFRTAGQNGNVTVTLPGHTLVTDAQSAVVRFDGDKDFGDIKGGLMVHGTRLWYDDQFVMGINNNGARGDMTFSNVEVVVDYDPGGFGPGYFVGPFVPATAVVEGVPQAVDMLNYPHVANTAFPLRVGRSPKNELVDPAYKYDVALTLRDGEYQPVSGWAANRFKMDFVNCQNPQSGLLPDGASNHEGIVVWTDGLDTGGSAQPLGSAVKIYVNYDGTGFHLFKTYPTITSPDENGDGVINASDETIFNNARAFGTLYQADMNRDNAINARDVEWFDAHKNQARGITDTPQQSAPAIPLVMDLAHPNPLRSGEGITISLPVSGPVDVTLFDVQGRVVRKVVNEDLTAGVHRIAWDGLDDGGRPIRSGLYLVKLATREGAVTRNLLLLP